MKLIHRIGYYLGGFSIGLIFLAFFLNGKKVTCDYGPEARVLKNINLKSKIYSSTAKSDIVKQDIDTIAINSIIKDGSINFSKSNTRKKPCGVYCIEDTKDNKEVEVYVENCDSLVTVQNIKIINN